MIHGVIAAKLQTLEEILNELRSLTNPLPQLGGMSLNGAFS